MMAPLRLPSIDWELPIAITICGRAGIATVSGTCAIEVGVAALTAEWLARPRMMQASTPSRTTAGCSRQARARLVIGCSRCIELMDDALQRGARGSIRAHGVGSDAVHRTGLCLARRGAQGIAWARYRRQTLDDDLRQGGRCRRIGEGGAG